MKIIATIATVRFQQQIEHKHIEINKQQHKHTLWLIKTLVLFSFFILFNFCVSYGNNMFAPAFKQR